MKINIDKSNWRKVKLGDISFEYSSRINDPSKSERDRFIGSSNISQWDFRLQSWESTESVTSAMKLFESSDYLLVRRSLYASDFRERAPRADFSGVCSGDILTIRENPEFIIDGFLIAILNSPELWKFIVANASGSITRRIKWKDLASYEFLLPPINEQQELADLFWATENTLNSERKVLKELKSTRKSLREHELCARHFHRLPLNEVLNDIIAGKSLNGVNIPIKGSEKGVIKISAVGDDGFVPSENKILNEQSEFLEKYQVNQGDILITRANTNELVGRTCLVEDNYPNLMLSDKTLKLALNEDKVNGTYIVEILNSRESRKQIEAVATGTGNAMKNISQKKLRDIKIPVPSRHEQDALIEKLNIIKENYLKVKDQISYLTKMKKSLISQVF
jgi:restriction endonuclease S subunit